MRKTLVFKSVRKIFLIVSKPDHTHGKGVGEWHIDTLFCFLTDTFARNQLSQRHRSSGGGAGVKPGLLGSLTVGAVPKSTLESSALLVFGVGAGVVRRLRWPGQVGGRNTEGARHRTPRDLAPAAARGAGRQ